MTLTRSLLSSSLAALLVAVLSNFPHIQAHSWADCVDWRFNSGVKATTPGAFADGKGKCNGYARRYNFKKEWGTLDSDFPSRHYLQKAISNPQACSNGKNSRENSGANEQKGSPIASAYDGKFGPMTVTKKGSQLCLRWPAKTHAVDNEQEHFVFIRMIPSEKEKKNGLQSEFGSPVAKLPYKNCEQKGDEDKWFCGGCFKLPARVSPGMWTLQWRWLLNEEDKEFYTSCADVQITA